MDSRLTDIYHRPQPSVRSTPPVARGPRLVPLNPPKMTATLTSPGGRTSASESSEPSIWGMPLKYVSLVTLAVQNATLSVVMHYSRVAVPKSQSYSPAAAVLMNELLKGTISFLVAYYNMCSSSRPGADIRMQLTSQQPSRLARLWSDVFGPDCWKLSIPAILYVIQNSLQFVAISNLPVASFQVTYQMKILTTAAFTVALLRKKLSPTKWVALFFLALGVAIVQIQATTTAHPPPPKRVGSAHEEAPLDLKLDIHIMNPLVGFMAVTAACFTSGLAGVYFEMVLKKSKADLWVRNVQLSLFSLIPAILPILFSSNPTSSPSTGIFYETFRNFGFWAWATVGMQVFGGLVTAIVIKYSDNIMKGFATSLSIILSFLASVALFDFHITPSFVIGSMTVLAATWLYNQPDNQSPIAAMTGTGSRFSTPLGSPVRSDAPIIGQPSDKKVSPFSSTRNFAAAIGLSKSSEDLGNLPRNGSAEYFPSVTHTHTKGNASYLSAPYGSPYATPHGSRSPSRVSSPNPPSPNPENPTQR